MKLTALFAHSMAARMAAPLVGAFVALAAVGTAGHAQQPAPAEIRVGLVPGPDVEIWEQVRKVAAERGLKLKLVQFSDYIIPNQALADGDLEANAFQHEPYLANQVSKGGWKLVKAGETITSPMGLYSAKLKSLEAIPAKATIAIQNDPTNGGRALKLLADKGLIKLKDGARAQATVRDIADNPKKLKFIELDAAQMARSLPDVDAATINSNYAVEAGLDPINGNLAREDVNGPWVNIIAVRAADKDQPWVKALLSAYQSEPVKQYINEKFKGVYVPAW